MRIDNYSEESAVVEEEVAKPGLHDGRWQVTIVNMGCVIVTAIWDTEKEAQDHADAINKALNIGIVK